MIPEVGSYNEKSNQNKFYIVIKKKRDYFMIPEGVPTTKTQTKINFGWFFYFFLTLKSKLLK
jgi:hypothetical protein